MTKKQHAKISSYLNRNKRNPREMFRTCWTEINTAGNKMLCFTNTHTGFLLNEIPEDISINHDYNTDFMNKILNDFEPQIDKESPKEIDLQGLKQQLKQHREHYKNTSESNNPPTCQTTIGEYTYNTLYLIDCMEILSGEDIKLYQPKENKLAGSIFISENGYAVVMSIRK